MTIVLLALAGGLGAWLRFTADGHVRRLVRSSVPLGTLVINVTGSLVLGALTGYLGRHLGFDDLRTIVGTGLLGGFTTFSTAVVEVATLLRQGRRLAGGLLWLGMVGAGLLAAVAGLWVGSL